MSNSKVISYATNNELRSLISGYNLTQREVAEYTQSSVETVKGWCSPIPANTHTSTRFRYMPVKKLSQLKLRLSSPKKPASYSYKDLRSWLRQKRQDSSLSLAALAKSLDTPSIAKLERSERKIEIMEFLAYCQAVGADPYEALDIIIQENVRLNTSGEAKCD